MTDRPVKGAAPRFSLGVTGRGWIYLSLSLAIGVVAILKGNNLLFAIYSILVGLLLSTLVLSFRSGRNLRISRTLPELAYVHDPFTIHYRVEHRGRGFPLYALRMHDRMPGAGRAPARDHRTDAVFVAPPGGSIDTRTSIRAIQRGWFSIGPVALDSECPPGLFRGRTTVETQERVLVGPRRAVIGRRVLPRLLAQTELPSPAAATHRNGEDEFAGLREFQPGDHPRRIHWKASFRVPHRLLVKEYDDSSHRRTTILLDTCLPTRGNPRDRALLERAICFSIALAEALCREGYTVRVVAHGSERLDVTLEDIAEAPALLHSAMATMGPGTLPLEAAWRESRISSRDKVFIVSLSESFTAPGQARVVPPSQMRMLMHYV